MRDMSPQSWAIYFRPSLFLYCRCATVCFQRQRRAWLAVPYPPGANPHSASLKMAQAAQHCYAMPPDASLPAGLRGGWSAAPSVNCWAEQRARSGAALGDYSAAHETAWLAANGLVQGSAPDSVDSPWVDGNWVAQKQGDHCGTWCSTARWMAGFLDVRLEEQDLLARSLADGSAAA